MLRLAADVALGRPFAGHEAEGGRIGYLLGENAADVMIRWLAMSEHLGFDANAIDVHFIDHSFDIDRQFSSLEAGADALGGFDLVLVDTSPSFFLGDDENSNSQMAAHARKLRRLTKLKGNPCVVALCIPGRAQRGIRSYLAAAARSSPKSTATLPSGATMHAVRVLHDHFAVDDGGSAAQG